MVAGDNTESREEKFKEREKRCQWKLKPPDSPQIRWVNTKLK